MKLTVDIDTEVFPQVLDLLNLALKDYPTSATEYRQISCEIRKLEMAFEGIKSGQ